MESIWNEDNKLLDRIKSSYTSQRFRNNRKIYVFVNLKLPSVYETKQ